MEMDIKGQERLDELLQYDTTALMGELGVIEQHIIDQNQEVIEQAKSYSAQIEASESMMGLWDDIKDLGKRTWEKAKPKIYDLLCKEESEDRNKLVEALKKDGKSFAMLLAPSLVASVGMLPVAALIVAAIAAKIAMEAGKEALCEKWKESLDV